MSAARRFMVVAVLAAGVLGACTDAGGAQGSTTLMSRPGWVDRTTTSGITTTSTLPAATTTTPAQRPKGSGWSPPEGLTDEQLKQMVLVVTREYYEGGGSEDQAKVNQALRASTAQAHQDVLDTQKLLKEKNQADRGEFFMYGGAQAWHLSPTRRTIRFVFCMRDNIARTDKATGQVVSPVPLPRPVQKLAVALQITPDNEPADGSAPGNYWKIVLSGPALEHEATCPP